MVNPSTGEITTFERGRKFFELSNHLGNVLVTVSDRKLQVQDPNNPNQILYYTADVKSANDYAPFGASLPGRSFSAGGYRYGFNGFEKDDEVKGEGNHISFNDYGLDVRIGRRWNIDPVVQHDISPYAVFNNNPNFFVDPDGESPISIFVKLVAKAGLKKAAKESVEALIKKRLAAYMSKNWAKQLGKDALDAIDIATSQSWWEYVIEVIPVVGDAYGAAQLGKQGHRTWKVVQKFESIAEWASTAATKTWKALGANKLLGKGADKIDDIVRKFNNQGSKFDEESLGGAVKEIYGLKSGLKADGTPYQHLKKVRESLSGMASKIEDLKGQIKGGVFEGDALKAAKGILNDVSKQYNEISNTLKGAEKAAKKF